MMYNDFNCDSISYCAKILNIHSHTKNIYINMCVCVQKIYAFASVHVYTSTHICNEVISIQGII